MKKRKITELVGLAALIGIMIVLQFLSTLLSGLSLFPISLVLIPIVIGGAVYGVKGGTVLGAAFGVMTFIFCLNGMDKGGVMVLQANWILCFVLVVVKAVMAGFLSSLVYKSLSGKKPFAAMLLSAIICPTVNTGIFILGMLTVFRSVLHDWAGGTDILTYALSGIVLMNYVPELIINVVFSPASLQITKAVKKIH